MGESLFDRQLRELTPAEIEARAKKADRLGGALRDRTLERNRGRLASANAEELALADYGLKVLDESLLEARGLKNWD